MTTSRLSPLPGAHESVDDAQAAALAARWRTLLALGLATAPRSRQQALGPSDAGHPCDRRLAYQWAGTLPVNFGDPIKATVGNGVHHVFAEGLRRLVELGAHLSVEAKTTFRNVSGTYDVYDQETGDLIDWKTTTKARLTKYRKDGPPGQYVTQLRLYAAGLANEGVTVKRLALIFVPTDGTLNDLWAWITFPDHEQAGRAVDRLDQLAGMRPSEASAQPERYCGYCPYYSPNSTDLDQSCPGPNQKVA